MGLVLDEIKAGVVTGGDLTKLYQIARENGFAIPAVNVVGSNSVNAILEAASAVNSPVIIQVSHGGAGFFGGKGIDAFEGSIFGALSMAKHVHMLAIAYNIPVVLHTDHASRELLPWIDGLIRASEDDFKRFGKPLFSSHMLDLSEESLEKNIDTSVEYLRRLSAIDMTIEVELGVTGGEEDGVDNSSVDNAMLYTQPEDVAYAYERLGAVSNKFTIAASFGNVHGVYKPGNVVLTPKILDNSQQYIQHTYKTSDKPVNFVFHGGSGSSDAEIAEAVRYGVVKMNLDTDIQWAFWDGVRKYEAKYHDFLQAQIGNPEGDDKPNKKYYDPRKWLREGEKAIVERMKIAFEQLNCIDRN